MRTLALLVAATFAACSTHDLTSTASHADTDADASADAHADALTNADATEAAAPHPKAAILRMYQRAGPGGVLPPGVLWRELVPHQQRLAAMPDTNAGPSNWTLLGPGNIGGRIRSILIHPTNPSTMWVGSVGGGVWKTVNAGNAWTMTADIPAVLTVTTMVLDPQTPTTLYAGTGEECFFGNGEGSSNSAVAQGAGVFKSTDGGDTWVHLPATGTAAWNSVARLAIDPTNPSTLVAATISGIWRSTDAGATWSQRTTRLTLDVEFDPNDATKLVAGRDDGIAQWSIDGGITWNDTARFPNVTRVELEYARSVPDMVYASTSVQGANLTLWRSTDGGRTFTVRSSGSIVSTLSNYDNALWVDPTNENRVIVGGLDAYRSANGGSTWTKISNWSSYPNSAHADQHEIVEHPLYDGVTNTTVYFGNDGGIQRATNVLTVATTSGWTNLNRGLAITQLYGVCINPTSGVILGGAQDNGTSRGTPTSGIDGWTQPGGGDGSYCAADPTNPNYFYLQSQYLGLRRSSNGGLTSGTNIANGISESSPNFIAYILLDPNDANRLYACGARLWRTNNAKSSPPTWSAVKPAVLCPTLGEPGTPPAHFSHNPPCNVSTVTVALGNSNVVWVGHNNGHVYKSTDALAATPLWTKVDDNGVGLPDRWVSRIVVDKNDHNRVTVAFLGFTPDNVWRTTDGGNTWAPIVGSGANRLPAVPVSCVVQHRVVGGRLYAATDLGLFHTDDDGANWAPAVGGPTIVGIDELVWKDDRTLIVATHGRSIWSCDVDPASVVPVGVGCGLATPPSLAVSPPRIGSAQTYTLTNAATNAPVSLLLGAGPPQPVALGPCTVQPSLIGVVVLPFGTTSGTGGLVANLPIPADAAFVGAIVTVQQFIGVGGGPLLQVGELSNGASLTFGF